MEVKVIYIEQLLGLLANKTTEERTNKGFTEMSAMINDSGINKKYLYENLHLNAMKATKKNKTTLSLQLAKLDIIAKYVSGQSFRELCEQLDLSRNTELLSCIGNYYCYVRRNAAAGVVMRSPVQISEKKNKITFELRGPKWVYQGEAHLKNGCLFVLMRAQGGKEIHHVYKLGTREKPEVLQGMFSGVSTVFEPISGRTVLIRTEEKYDQLKNEELEVRMLKKSKDKVERRLGEYFSAYENNNLRINSVITFTEDDLGNCR